jgi:hypothetical protein
VAERRRPGADAKARLTFADDGGLLLTSVATQPKRK